MILKPLIFNIVVFILIGCKAESEDVHEQDKNINFRISGSRLNIGDVSKMGIDHIVIKATEGKKYCLVLDSLGRISEIQDIIQLPHEKEYVNTWIGFDKQGQIDFPRSYYYGTFLSSDETMVYLNCKLERILFEDSKYSILVSDFNDDYETKSKVDTILFNDNYMGIIPIENWEIGENNIKFIILEEGVLNGKPRYRKTYVDKDFFIQEPE